MRGVADPTTVAAFGKGFEGIRESLEDTTETIGKVRKFIKGFIGDLGKIAKKGGVLPGTYWVVYLWDLGVNCPDGCVETF